ncbi:MAG: hypothetical protein ABF636_01035 [Acetobacter sp.]
MTLYRVLLKDAAAKALVAGKTLAGDNIMVDRSLPATPDKLPAILLTAPRDRATSTGRNGPGFTRVSTLAIRALLCGKTPTEVSANLDIFAEQIELALVLDPTLQGMITQITDIETELMINSQTAEHTGEVRMLLGLEYIEYYPQEGMPATELIGQVQANGNDDFAGFKVPLSSN